MRTDSIFCIVGALIVVLSCALPTSAGAECIRFKPSPRPPNVGPDMDGPGSFGELQGTVTLDCLKYAGSIEKQGVEQLLIQDERGTIHKLQLGSYMGENFGVISRIDPDTIYITQLIDHAGQWEEVIVRFPRHK